MSWLDKFLTPDQEQRIISLAAGTTAIVDVVDVDVLILQMAPGVSSLTASSTLTLAQVLPRRKFTLVSLLSFSGAGAMSFANSVGPISISASPSGTIWEVSYVDLSSTGGSAQWRGGKLG